jgi:hypothetical protein
MSKFDKLKEKLQQKPKDFKWDDLEYLLEKLGYTQRKPGKTSGSRRCFFDEKKQVINLHKPHPDNVIKQYVIKYVVEVLEERGQI